ncbi:MAG: outer membrane protein assembly factor BamC [Litorilituus sp.]|nr:outer membrane protein assembly factor BamC [Litorilituus sp.]
MSRQLFYFSVLSLTLSACSGVDSKRAQGDFDYAKKVEPKEIFVPETLDKPKEKNQFLVTDKISYQGPVGDKMDIRAPSLVLPLAASSRVETGSDQALIWFDKVLEDRELLTFIKKALVDQLNSDKVAFTDVSVPANQGKTTIQSIVVESDWFHSEVETGWLFTEIELSTSLRFRYQLTAKPHGRSVSLAVTLIDYMKTDSEGGSKNIDPIDKQRAEMAMLNKLIAQVDYNYRLQQRENRLMRANQKLVKIAENKVEEPAYAVEMALDNLWSNMPVFFEKHGFTITDLDETNKIYFVDFIKPTISLWDSIWGDDESVIELPDATYQFVLAPLDDTGEKTSVSIYSSNGEPLELATLEHIFPVIEKGLSFRNFY